MSLIRAVSKDKEVVSLQVPESDVDLTMHQRKKRQITLHFIRHKNQQGHTVSTGRCTCDGRRIAGYYAQAITFLPEREKERERERERERKREREINARNT